MMMFAALLKKQLYELNKFYFTDKKTGKRRSRGGVVGTVVLFGFLFLFVAVAFFGIAQSLAIILIPSGQGWLLLSLSGLLSIVFGTFGSVFNTYAGLYHAKDNELLLSMPIPPAMILAARMVSVYLMSLLYSALVWVPAAVTYIIWAPSAISAVFLFLLMLIIALFVTVFTCALGWVVALIAAKLKNKSFITVIITLVFLGGYYFVCFRASDLIELLILNGDKIGTTVQTWLYPIYQLGLAGTGEVLPMLIFTAITLALFALCVFILSRSFIKIVTTNKGSAKKIYREKKTKSASPLTALFRKELHHFTASPTYMLNCGLGAVIMPVLAVIALVKSADITEAFNAATAEIPFLSGILPILFTTAVLMITSLNAVSAPSVSLEGKNIWISQSLPVRGREVLRAKIGLHVAINFPPAFIGAILLGISASAGVINTVFMILISLLFVFFTAVLGLSVNLKKPNLSWTNESIPIKQSVSVLISLFGGWIVAALFGAGYLLLPFIQPWQYILIFMVLLGTATGLLFYWIETRGEKLFEQLS